MSDYGQSAQRGAQIAFQTLTTANGNGIVFQSSGYKTMFIELANTAGTGTAALDIEGTIDTVKWYGVGYQVIATGSSTPVGGVATPSRAVAAITVAAFGNAGASQYIQVLDLYPQIRCRIASVSGTVSINCNLYAIPI